MRRFTLHWWPWRRASDLKKVYSADGPEEWFQTLRRFGLAIIILCTHTCVNTVPFSRAMCVLCTQPFSRASSIWNSTLNKRSNAQLVVLLHSLPAQVIERSKLSVFSLYMCDCTLGGACATRKLTLIWLSRSTHDELFACGLFGCSALPWYSCPAGTSHAPCVPKANDTQWSHDLVSSPARWSRW